MKRKRLPKLQYYKIGDKYNIIDKPGIAPTSLKHYTSLRMTAEKFKQLSLFLQVYTQLVKDHFKVKRAKDKRLSKTEKNV